jgi:RNA polymerase sigma factor (sigma-70 family)
MATTTELAGAAARATGAESTARRAELYARVLERIHRYFRRMIRDPGEAEECVSRTILELERALETYDAARSYNTWMWIKAHTVWAQWCRERSRPIEALGDREPAARPEGDVAAALDVETVLAEVSRRLGEETHEAFVLYYESGLTQQEVADALGRDRGTIVRRLKDAHALIDRLLGGARK